ncbi:MAG TPA: hypothetical protein VL651_15145 [Bacteroidia bacterium]|nr:hypothetical protein [Bacteroidia bacterium]
MKSKNFLLSAILLTLVLGGGYYYFETHSLLASFGWRKWCMYALYYAIGCGTITTLYVIATKKGWNSFLFWNSLQLNFCGTIGIFYYMYYYSTLLMRGKILLYVVAVIALFVLQTVVFFANRKRA